MATNYQAPAERDTQATSSKYRFPPGPSQNVIISGIKNRGPVDPLKFFRELTETYGDAAHYRIGRKDVVLLNSPALAREVFIVQHSSLMKERTQQRAKLLLGEGMITADFATHRKQRQVAQPAFHRQRVPVHADTIVRLATESRERWRNGEVVDVYREMMHLALAIVGETFFTTDLSDEVAELNQQVGNIMDVYNAVVLLPAINFLLKLPFTPLRKFVQAKDRLDRTVYRIIDEHRLGKGEGDLLSMMVAAQDDMQWSDRDLRDQVVTTFLAGYETTAIALTWTVYLLSQNPSAMQQLFEEVDRVLGGRPATYDDLPQLKFAEMVIAEGLRLYPPAWAMGREAVEDVEFGEWRVPKGTTFIVSQFIMHRDAKYFPDPTRFEPARHTPEAKASRQRFSYFPFGMGPRQCIGEAFAWMEAVLVLATLVQRWRFELLPGQSIEPQPLFTLRPRNGIRMRLAEK